MLNTNLTNDENNDNQPVSYFVVGETVTERVKGNDGKIINNKTPNDVYNLAGLKVETKRVKNKLDYVKIMKDRRFLHYFG